MKRSLRTLPTANLDFLQRIHKWGLTWILLFVVFFAAHPNSNFLFKVVSSACFVALIALLVAFINKVLIRHLLQNHRVVLFILLAILAIGLWSSVSVLIDMSLIALFFKESFSELAGAHPFEPLLSFLLRMLWFVAAFAVTVVFYFQRKENEAKIVSDQLKSEKLDMELRYLKSQINPHFLFNALNNIYSMVYTHDDNAADGVLKLSEMLRYVLVDCQAEMIPLSKEIKYIENFIDFQKMRMGGHRDVTFLTDVENEDFMIAPMLLQPLIENCFKYSRLETHPEGQVHVSIRQQDQAFCFEAVNTIAPNALPIASMGAEEKKSGIGLKNVQQRLMLHYGEDYVFDIEQDKITYKVKIEL